MIWSNEASIRRRLLLLALLALASASIALYFFLHTYAHSAAERAFDRLLGASALTIAGSVQIGDDGITVEPPFSALAMLPGSERVFYQALNNSGQVITGYTDLAPDLALAQSAEPRFAYDEYHDDPLRVATVGRLVSASQYAGWVTVRVAETLGARESLADEMLKRSLWPLLLVAALALALLWFGIQRAFVPLALLERELRHREPDDLVPLRTPVPREVRRLTEALNGFMQRLGTVMDSMNMLVADAAHQVRTPLASLRAQAEVALEESDPQRLRERVARIHQNATHASHLINQLLMDATISHRLGRGERVQVGVAQVINETRRRIGPLDAQRLHIDIAASLRRARVMGDRVALREMLRNLVDNALRYGAEGTVDIVVTRASADRLALIVSDRGPGIADADKERVQQRFERGPTALSGSGLGLAIARAVARAHGGQLCLQDRPGGGLQVRVELPLAAQSPTAVSRRSTLFVAALLVSTALVPRPSQADDAIQESVYPSALASGRTLTIAGPTDTPVIRPLIEGFQRERPDVTVVYREIGSLELYRAAVGKQLQDVDVLISSAPDLQIRLANDGYAMSHPSRYARDLPPWAKWRNEVFGFTFEPIVIAYNPRRFSPETAPQSRQALLRLLERDEVRLRGRVGSYDIAVSNVGYLLAEQDELVSSNFWGLANALGRVGVRLVASSGEILDAIERDELDLGYNVLASYALDRQRAGAPIGVVMPEDYMLVLSRSALILRSAPQPDLARALVDWLLSPVGQMAVASQSALGAVVPGTPGEWSIDTWQARARGIVQPVVLSSMLLAGLDQQRQTRFIQNWMRLVTDTPPLLP